MSIIAIIGSGNMGASLIGGLIRQGQMPQSLWSTDPSQEKLAAMHEKFGVNITANNQEAVASADVIIFAVKPQIFSQVAIPLRQIIHEKKPLVISIAAGIPTKHIADWLSADTAIIRAMPNTPALYGYGATGLFANQFVNEKQRALAETILNAVGITVWVQDESLMDIITALSGSGPAYFFLLMEALQQAAVHLGLNSDTAYLLTIQTALGAAIMAKESHEHFTTLRQQVTSPGGTTEKAIAILQENNVIDIIKQALLAAKSRSEELAKFSGENT